MHLPKLLFLALAIPGCTIDHDRLRFDGYAEQKAAYWAWYETLSPSEQRWEDHRRNQAALAYAGALSTYRPLGFGTGAYEPPLPMICTGNTLGTSTYWRCP